MKSHKQILKNLEALLLIADITTRVLEIVKEEHPEIITRAIIETMKKKKE